MKFEYIYRDLVSIDGRHYDGLIVLRVDDITYQIQRIAGRAPMTSVSTQDLRFLTYQVGEQKASFAQMPYEDERFSFAVSLFTALQMPILVELEHGEPEIVQVERLCQFDIRKFVGPVWCPVANIVPERPYGPGGEEHRRGTKHFPPGAKIYCHAFFWGRGGEDVEVIGRHRGSHRYEKMIVRSAWLTHWRADLVYSPHVIRQLWPTWNGSEQSKTQAESIVAEMVRRGYNQGDAMGSQQDS